jgi:hypothetical protein
VNDAEFDAIFGRIKEAGIRYGSCPFSQKDMQTNNWREGGCSSKSERNGHLLELLIRC